MNTGADAPYGFRHVVPLAASSAGVCDGIVCEAGSCWHIGVAGVLALSVKPAPIHGQAKPAQRISTGKSSIHVIYFVFIATLIKNNKTAHAGPSNENFLCNFQEGGCPYRITSIIHRIRIFKGI